MGTISSNPKKGDLHPMRLLSKLPKAVFLIVIFIIIGAIIFITLMKDKNRSPVKIGIVLPLSGDFEIYGKMGLNGARMAVAEINEDGGVLNGRPLELIVEDNQTDPNISVRLTRKLIQEDDVTALMGPVSSSARNAMTEIAAEFKTPLLYGIDYEGGIYNRYLFCYSMIPDHYVKPLIPYLMENYGKKFYVFGYDYIWPHKIAEAIKREVSTLGGEVTGIEFTPFGIQDYSKTFEKIKNTKADILMLILPGTDGFRFLKQITDIGLKEKIKIAAMAADESYLKALDAKSLEGVISAVHFLSSLENKETRKFVRNQKRMFGKNTEVTYATEAHYGLVKLFREAIKKAGTDNREQIISAMENLTIVVGNGPVKMRKDHHMNLNIVISEFTDGKLIEKQNIGLIVPENQKKGNN